MPRLHRSRADADSLPPRLLGRSAAWTRTLDVAARLARSRGSVLLTGESGVGKSAVARHLHLRSTRAGDPFVTVSCAGLSDALLGSELFGHARAGSSSTPRGKTGRLRQADRGTILLDDIDEMGPAIQAALLRFLESGEVAPAGADGPAVHVDVRVIAASSKDLFGLVGDGRFREDLLYRLAAGHLAIPPLRDRREDIPLFVEHALAACGRRRTVSDRVQRALQAYRWPGNVRELQNVLDQVTSTARGSMIEVEDLPPRIQTAARTTFVPRRERRRRVADDLFDQLLAGQCAFWEDIRPLLLNRDMTRADLRQLVGLGLAASGGTYRGLLERFRLPQEDYKRLLNFLAAHGCSVDGRDFRPGEGSRTPARAGAPRRAIALDGHESSDHRQTVV